MAGKLKSDPDVRAAFLKILRDYHGRMHAIKRADLLIKIRGELPKLVITDRHMRIAKVDLIKNGFPICSGEQGYYYADTREDEWEARMYLRKKTNALLAEEKALRLAFEADQDRRRTGPPQQMELLETNLPPGGAQ